MARRKSKKQRKINNAKAQKRKIRLEKLRLQRIERANKIRKLLAKAEKKEKEQKSTIKENEEDILDKEIIDKIEGISKEPIAELAKNKAVKKCLRLIDKSYTLKEKGNINGARKVYIKARKRYIGLDYENKKEIYNALNTLYNELSKS